MATLLQMAKRLEELDKSIAFSEQESSRIKGRIESEQQKLEDFDLANEVEAEIEISNLEELGQTLDEEIQKDFSKLEEEYDW